MKNLNTRQYRSSVAFQPVEDEEYIVEGYATTFNDPYELYDGIYEVIDNRALDCADMSDIIFQLNHEGTVMARLRNKSLVVSTDEHGLHVRANLGGSQAGRDLYESIKNGLVDRMSWGFTVNRDGWCYDEKTRTSTITSVKKVFDVSAVSIPANDGTEIKARSYLNGEIEVREQQELLRSEQEKREKLSLLLKLKG